MQLIKKLKDEDNITISTFNEYSKQIFPYQKVSELKTTDYTTEIEKLKATGGTNILAAFQGAYSSMYWKNAIKIILEEL